MEQYQEGKLQSSAKKQQFDEIKEEIQKEYGDPEQISSEVQSVQQSIDKFHKYYTQLCEQEYKVRDLIQQYQLMQQKSDANERETMMEKIKEVQTGSHQPVFNAWPENQHDMSCVCRNNYHIGPGLAHLCFCNQQ